MQLIRGFGRVRQHRCCWRRFLGLGGKSNVDCNLSTLDRHRSGVRLPGGGDNDSQQQIFGYNPGPLIARTVFFHTRERPRARTSPGFCTSTAAKKACFIPGKGLTCLGIVSGCRLLNSCFLPPTERALFRAILSLSSNARLPLGAMGSLRRGRRRRLDWWIITPKTTVHSRVFGGCLPFRNNTLDSGWISRTGGKPWISIYKHDMPRLLVSGLERNPSSVLQLGVVLAL